MIYYYIFLCLLIFIYLLFVFDLVLRISVSLDHLKIKIFGLTVFSLKNEKYHNFLKKLIPKDKIQANEEIDLSALISFIHIYYLNLTIKNKNEDYVKNIYLKESILILTSLLRNLICNKVDNYQIKIINSEKNDFSLYSVFYFNIGIILLNYIIIKKRYRNERRKADKWNS